MTYFYLCLVFVLGYFFGCISFARIFMRLFAKKDVTTVGSKNPGSMNVLRTRGVGEALLTLLADAIKTGAPALVAYFVFKAYVFPYQQLAYFLTCLGGIFGHCFPVFYKFKGGKGVAPTFGMFLFHPWLWWITLVVFVLCFVLFFFVPYGFIISFVLVFVMSICATCIFAVFKPHLWIALLVILWLICLLILVQHRKNIVRLFRGEENKVNFKEKMASAFKKNKKESDASQNVEKKENDAPQNIENED